MIAYACCVGSPRDLRPLRRARPAARDGAGLRAGRGHHGALDPRGLQRGARALRRRRRTSRRSSCCTRTPSCSTAGFGGAGAPRARRPGRSRSPGVIGAPRRPPPGVVGRPGGRAAGRDARHRRWATAAEGDVDALDGLLLVLSPWAVRELRCDTATFTGFHAYDVDLCLQARAAGRRVVARPFAVFHHAAGGKDRLDAGFVAADAALRRKWGLAPPGLSAAAAPSVRAAGDDEVLVGLQPRRGLVDVAAVAADDLGQRREARRHRVRRARRAASRRSPRPRSMSSISARVNRCTCVRSSRPACV